MELFGFGTPSELATPIGQTVKHATDNLRLVPDWTMNLEICDQLNRRHENIETAIKAIHRRLQDSNVQTVYLTLILLETCMKNCGTSFASSFDRHLMDDVVKIGKGSKGIKNSDHALRLIQQWGRVFESRRSTFPLFFDTFIGLKSKGISFPPEDENPISGYDMDSPHGAPKRSVSTSKPSAAPMPAPAPPAASKDEEDEFFRLQRDMLSVMDKVKLCREMLLESPGIEADEALAEVVGFLEACKDRMVDIIEAGTQGLLGEDLFSQCLRVNDAICKTLDAERNGLKIPVEDDEAEGKGEKKPSSNSLLDLDSPKAPVPAMPVAAAKASSIAADFGLFDKVPAAPAVAASIVTDPFDDPFNDNFNKAAAISAPAAQVPVAHTPATPAPAPSAATPAPVGLENNPFADPSDLPPAPAPAQKDDFDFFLQTAAPATTAPVAQPPAAPPGGDEDFDAFFASLEKK